MRSRIKGWLHIGGGVLALVSVGFVLERLYRYSDQIELGRFESSDGLLLLVLAVGYGAANCLLALGWWRLLLFFDGVVGWRWALRTYGVSQLAKYVPGNIFQFAGRQFMGMARGLGALALMKSTVWELGLVALAGAVVGMLAVPLVWPQITSLTAFLAFLAMTLGAVLFMGRVLSKNVAIAWCCQLVFLISAGIIFFMVLFLTAPEEARGLSVTGVCGAYVIGWLAGLVTPGSPAGMGVREAVLLVLLGGVVSPENLLLAIIVARIVTVGGDFAFFLSCLKAENPIGLHG